MAFPVEGCVDLKSFVKDALKYKNTKEPVIVAYCAGGKPDILKYISDIEDPSHSFTENLGELCDMEINPWNIIETAYSATHILFLYEAGPVISGFALVTIGKPVTTVHIICAEKGQGYGRLLIDRVKEMAVAEGSSSIQLEAIKEALVTKVYEPMGFKRIEEGSKEMKLDLSQGGSRRTRRRRNRRRTGKSRGKR